MALYKYSGDRTIAIIFGNEISPDINALVRSMDILIKDAAMQGVEETVPTYRSLYVYYDPLKIDVDTLLGELKTIERKISTVQLPPPRVVDVPVVYGGEYGPDIEYVARFHNISVKDVIEHHANRPYLVYMLGFTPGFTFLGSVDDVIATPRLKSPRLKVPAGSVGIAGKQTGVYAVSSPGGWQLIGRTYYRFYDPLREPPTLVRPGDYVRFIPISAEEFEQHREKVDSLDIEEFNIDWEPTGSPVAEIVSGGMFSTIQDSGRYGYQALGISVCGAMDELSFRMANRLVGNDENAAVVEVAFMGFSLCFLKDTVIAITGGDLTPQLNGKPVDMFRSIDVKKGDLLKFAECRSGFRAYLAVAGGIDVPVVMGSRSTDLKAKIGGMKGRKLKKGDILYSFDVDFKDRYIVQESPRCAEKVMRVIVGPDEDYFTSKGLETFLSSEFALTDKCDRMGCRLSGAYVEHNEKGAGIISDGISLGTIQVPGEGYPIVLLKDRQAVGGYTKIATLITVDAWKFSQLKPGDVVRFEKIDVRSAHKLLKRELSKLKGVIPINVKRYRLKVNGKVYNVTIEEVRK